MAELDAARGRRAEAVAALKQADGGDLHVIGSTQLLRTLIEHDLVDEYRLMIDPLVLGGGKRIFADDGVRRPFRLVEGQVTTTGAILATVRPGAGRDLALHGAPTRALRRGRSVAARPAACPRSRGPPTWSG